MAHFQKLTPPPTQRACFAFGWGDIKAVGSVRKSFQLPRVLSWTVDVAEVRATDLVNSSPASRQLVNSLCITEAPRSVRHLASAFVVEMLGSREKSSTKVVGKFITKCQNRKKFAHPQWELELANLWMTWSGNSCWTHVHTYTCAPPGRQILSNFQLSNPAFPVARMKCRENFSAQFIKLSSVYAIPSSTPVQCRCAVQSVRWECVPVIAPYCCLRHSSESRVFWAFWIFQGKLLQ